MANRFKTLRNKIRQRLDAGIGSYSARRRVMPESRPVEPRGRSYGLPLERHEIEITPRIRPPAVEKRSAPPEQIAPVRGDSTIRKRAVR